MDKEFSTRPAAFALMAHYSPGPAAAHYKKCSEVGNLKGVCAVGDLKGAVGNLEGTVGNLSIGSHSPFSPPTSVTDISSSRRAPRVQAKLETKIQEGKEAQALKSSTVDGAPWMKTFIGKKWGAQPPHVNYDRLRQRTRRSIDAFSLETKTGDVLQKPGRHVIPGGHRCRVVNPKERVRIASLPRQANNTLMPELQHELYQWWIDLTQHLQARVPTSAIMAEASAMIQDALEAGVVNPDRVPVITRMWIARWRRFYSIVPRCRSEEHTSELQSR